MGLDMYLEKQDYVKNWDHMTPDERHEITIKKGGVTKEPRYPVKYIVYEVGYWRKANAIHKWFVDNCGGGVDECQQIYVSHEKLLELLNICLTIKNTAKMKDDLVTNGWTSTGGEPFTPNLEPGQTLANPEIAQELLPTQGGFFFGSTDYDEWYMRDVEDTIDILSNAVEDEDASFYYQASW